MTATVFLFTGSDVTEHIMDFAALPRIGEHVAVIDNPGCYVVQNILYGLNGVIALYVKRSDIKLGWITADDKTVNKPKFGHCYIDGKLAFIRAVNSNTVCYVFSGQSPICERRSDFDKCLYVSASDHKV